MQKTVLLVDDEQGLLEPLADALLYEGHRVLKAATAARALQILSQEHVDVATIDIMLTPGDGLGPEFTPRDAGIHLCERIVREYPISTCIASA